MNVAVLEADSVGCLRLAFEGVSVGEVKGVLINQPVVVFVDRDFHWFLVFDVLSASVDSVLVRVYRYKEGNLLLHQKC